MQLPQTCFTHILSKTLRSLTILKIQLQYVFESLLAYSMHYCIMRKYVQVHFYGICVAHCPKKNDTIEGFVSDLDLQPVFHRCMPPNMTESSTEVDAYFKIFGRATSVFKYIARYIEDIHKTYQPILVCGGAIAFVAAIIWIILLRIFPSAIVWGSILLSLATLLLATAICASEASFIHSAAIDDLKASIKLNVQSVNQDYFKIASFVLLGMDIMYMMLLVFMFSRIRLSVGIIKEACRGLAVSEHFHTYLLRLLTF